MLIAFLVVLGTIYFTERGLLFIDIPSLLIVVLIPMALTIVSYGFEGFKELFELFLKFTHEPTTPQAHLKKKIRILDSYIIYTYASGVIGTFIGIIALLTNSFVLSVEDGLASFSVALLTLFYATLINEIKIRPTKKGLVDLAAIS